ncbi:MAG TPA: ribonuclease J [Pseudomonadota bacterium]|nr:ribonuclease J [Pseudomonadota bacterium]
MFVIPVGGCGEFGRNLTSYVCEETHVVVDCGIQMPDDLSPGVDHFVPDLSSLFDHFGPPHAVFLTHGHEDHVGAVYYLLRTLDRPIPVYGRPLALKLCEKRLRRSGVPQRLFDPRPLSLKQPLFVSAHPGIDSVGLSVTPLGVPHSIPDACSLLLEGPKRLLTAPFDSAQSALSSSRTYTVLHTGDFKVEGGSTFADPSECPPIDLLVGDSTNALVPGFSPEESLVEQALGEVLRTRKGRVAVTLFSSHIERIAHFAHNCLRYGRRLCLLGRGLHDAVEAARSVSLLTFPDSLLCSPDQAAELPKEQVALLCTGTQGESVAAFAKLVASLPEDSPSLYGTFRLQKGDTVVLSARAIPGHERPISRLADRLVAHGIEFLSGHPFAVSGHGFADDLEWLLRRFLPRALLPVHGGPRQLWAHGEIARRLCIPVLTATNGDVIRLSQVSQVSGELADEAPSALAHMVGHLPTRALAVEGNTTGQIGPETLRVRQKLAQVGLVVVSPISFAPLRFAVRTVGVSDPGPVHEDLCRQASRLAQAILKNVSLEELSQDERAPLEHTIARAVRGLFRTVYGKKTLVLCMLGGPDSQFLDEWPPVPSADPPIGSLP